MTRIVRGLGTVALLAVVVLAAVVATGPRSAVDWRSVRAVALESDDWGLCGFVPDAEALADLDREALGGGRFPEVYWRSTLETGADVDAMCDVLLRHRGRDGRPAVFQPNYILDALTYRSGDWLPVTPVPYVRPGLGAAELKAVEAGVWHPELHGRWHYDPELRRAAVDEGDAVVREAARRQVLVFPRAHRAYELRPGRDLGNVRHDLERALSLFHDRFGRAPTSIIAPDYVWDRRHEELWRDAGLRIVQAKREQRRYDLGGPAPWRRLRKFVERHRDYVVNRDRTYLERNCRLETAQSDDRDAVVAACADDVRSAWGRGEPAVVETHRVNFVTVDPVEAERGRADLDRLLTDLDADGPLYLCDEEIAQLTRRGTSAVLRAGLWTLRNPTSSCRLAVLTFPNSLHRSVIQIPARTVLILDNESAKIVDVSSLH